MPFIDEILKHKSLSIIGLEKNTGKTECLNYILSRLRHSDKKIALTSIGVDGESIDIIKSTPKPDIELFEDIVFITSEKHYRQRQLTSIILDISAKKTSLGRLITARSLSNGKVILSGPSDTLWLKSCIAQMQQYEVDTTIVDGAISRKSLASPAVTDCLILTTGASVSSNISNLIRKTRFIYGLINIPKLELEVLPLLLPLEQGIWSISDDNRILPVNIPSVFQIEQHKEEMTRQGSVLLFTGAITDKLLNFLKVQKNIHELTLVARDFTKFFISNEVLNDFQNRGGKLRVLYKPHLLAVCINPVSPDGYMLDSLLLQQTLAGELKIPVYDIKKLQV